ncbi:hypothetical protein E1J38_004235 [Seonamhaeicola sediminis]|uniref:Uncharacterized protein n=1 Tax=Seonamhaeicola sediminis TaxID=2528206 RepID=A0A562YGQ3_9FLAO|nr:hypothetical protein [Seonamhaeicola sediminis]TWO33992.1 hypothetical protein E1J38_004235 [Seonamhaeicola sediminis]
MSKDSQQSEEVDLGQLFKMIGNMFDKLFKFTGNIFNKLFLAFVWLVFFVKKHFLKFVIAGVLGIVLGFIVESKSEPVYKSNITIKQNYKTGEDLFNSINYYNELVNEGDITTLSKVLSIDSLDAASILSFEMESAISENEKLERYDEYLKGLDSILASTIEYKTYLENENDYNHSLQQIRIKSKERNNFNNVFDRIVDNVNTNKYFVREQQKDTLELLNRMSSLKEALVKSDSLQSTYKRVLEMRDQEDGSSQTSVTIKNADDVNKTREFELYKSDLELQREIVDLEREIEDKKYIVEVISSKQDSGSVDNTKKLLGKSVSPKIYYTIIFELLTFMVLIGFTFIKFLERYKDKI